MTRAQKLIIGLCLLVGIGVLARPFVGGLLPFVGPAHGPLELLIVEETNDRQSLSPGQLAVVTTATQPDAPIGGYLKSHCKADKHGLPIRRVLDRDNETSREVVEIQELWKLGAAEQRPMPYYVLRRGSLVDVQSLPRDITTEAFLATLKRYGDE